MLIEDRIPDSNKTEDFLKQMADLYPEPVVISNEEGIMICNDAAEKLVGKDIYGRSVIGFIDDSEGRKNATIKLKLMLKNQVRSSSDFYTLNINNDFSFDAEVTSGFVLVDNKPALFSIVRDVSVRKNELMEATRLQKNLIEKQAPQMPQLDFFAIYEPSQTISGDFYFHHQLNDHTLIGILGDVSGKGISAAMNISAFEVMYRTTVLSTVHPYDIVKELNRLSYDFFDDRYIATICYAIDLESHVLRIASAGISDFVVSTTNTPCKKHILKGPFLGMFNDLPFDYTEISLNVGDRFFFFTDGMEFIIDDQPFCKKILDCDLSEIQSSLKERIYQIEMKQKNLYDDCTIIGFEVKE